MARFGGAQAAVALADPAWQGGPQDGGSSRAREMPAGPGGHAPLVTQAWNQATAIREAAERDAAAIRQEAIAIREAAEKEAAEMRAAVMSMSEQLSQLAALLAPAGAPAGLTAPPAARPARPATRPARPATSPARPATSPARPATTRPGKPAARPGTTSQGRQSRAARKMVALLAVLVTGGVISGATELALHGGPFFIFRANGAGASETGPVENQGPGQPDAPGAHHPPPAKHQK
jgi:hypothetical protein